MPAKLLRLSLLLGSAVAVLVVVLALVHDEAAPALQRVAGNDTNAAAAGVPVAEPSLAQQATLPARQRAPETVPDRAASRAAGGRDKIRVLVVDRQERPIAGASVATFEDSRPGSTETDSDGRCVLQVAPGAGSMRVHVDANGFFHVRADYQRRAELGFKLFRAVPLAGTVRDRDSGEPVAGATVRSLHASCKGCGPDATRTDERGAFTLAGVPTGRQAAFVISAAEHPGQTSSVTFADQGERLEHAFTIRRGVWIAGRVVDWSTGAPVAQAKVGMRYGKGDDEVRTGADGAFRVLLLTSDNGRVDLQVTAKGYCDLQGPVPGSEVRSGADPQFRVPRSVPLAGLVRDREGRPVCGATVSVRRDPRARSEQSLEAKSLAASLRADWSVHNEDLGSLGGKTDADGRYQTAGGVAPWSGAYLLWVEHAEHLPFQCDVAAIGGPGETATVDVVLQPKGPSGSIAGRLSVNGVPSVGRVAWKGRSQAGNGEAGVDGEFRLQGVETGDVELTAVPARYDDVHRAARDKVSAHCRLSVTANVETRADLDVALAPSTITGRVSHRDGRPAAGKSVTAGSEGGMRVGATSRTDGTYALEVPSIGERFLVNVSHPGTKARRDVLAGATGVDFVLTDIGRVRYRAIDGATGTSLEGFELFVGPAGEDRSRRVERVRDASTPHGYRMLEAPLGRYDLEVFADDANYRPELLRDVQVDAEQHPRELTFSMQKAALVVIVRKAGQDRLPENVQVAVVPAEAAAKITGPEDIRWMLFPRMDRRPDVQAIRFDDRGQAVIRGLAPGEYRLLASRKDVLVEPDSITVPDAGEARVEVQWRLQRD